ncbi:helix-turn-helix transcriptional regulator [Streptomyces sp. NA04227]|uniref:helix-turn-helix transcriptional regulator n=1 Tax=Streptomyces sp. NA04227 TaxID=2742136 RepID=UPI001591FCAE|nr:helix-turn-helix transcriptional regulator [Streptomyces sp. NA04227]QKW07478.1 helix-turn-helix transcriptional regulator [Streptomyces sp. NA04227]
MHHEPHPHGTDQLCPSGAELYSRALRAGRVPHEEAADVPCVVDATLLQPDVNDARWLLPTPPAVALPRLLRSIEERIARERGREARLIEAFAPLLELEAQQASPPQTSGLTVLEGPERINPALSSALNESTEEVLTVQPGPRSPGALADSRPREAELLSRGGRLRTLYQHTVRHDPKVLAHFADVEGDVQVRTLDEVTERLLVFDRTVAFIPASKDRTLALEVRNPALIDYFVTTFERLWRLATPMHPIAARLPTTEGITARQRAIAELLVEGETDARIAGRLGMNVRTCRTHIANLAATLGSQSRAQLGYLIGQSGILDREQ